MSNVRPAVLISAFAAHPEMSSETGIGWQFLKATLSATREQGLEIVVLMNHRSSVVVQKELLHLGLADRVTLVGVDMPAGLKWLLRPQLTRLEYLVWNLLAQSQVRKLSRDFDFILAHHVTFATEMFPTPITACAPDTYKVWGPVGSAGDPEVYRVPPVNKDARREEILQRIRDFVVRLPMTLIGKKVDLVLAQNARVASEFAKRGIRAEVFPNVIIKEELQREIDSVFERPIPTDIEDANRPLRLLAVGHLVARKRFELGMMALTSQYLRNSTFHIIGTPLQGHPDYLPSIASRLGVSRRVQFIGRRQRPEVLAAMADYDVLIHPSGREGASGVVGEATAMGIPVFCFEDTGAASVLDDAGASGIRLKATSATTADDLAKAIRSAASLPRTRSRTWNESRFQNLQLRLITEARDRRSTRGLAG